MIDWQAVAMLALGALCSITLYEVRQLRKAKHDSAQAIQYALLCIAVLAKEVGVELPEFKRDRE